VEEQGKPGDITKPRYWAIIPAAGVGRRMQTDPSLAAVPKQYLELNGRTITEHTLRRVSQLSCLSAIVLVLGKEDNWWQTLNLELSAELMTAEGGAERANSVLNGLLSLQAHASAEDWVLVHDVVRPCVALHDMEKLISSFSNESVGGILAAPVRETLKRVKADLSIETTVPREHYWLAATPQMFRYGLLKSALEKALADNVLITDESHAMEYAGHWVKVVQGSSENIKITQTEDIFLAEQILKKQAGHD